MASVIFNSDNSVQGTIISITSTPLGINTSAYNTNLSILSTYSTLSIRWSISFFKFIKIILIIINTCILNFKKIDYISFHLLILLLAIFGE